MKKLSEQILKHKFIVLIVFFLLTLFSIFAMQMVKVNFDMVEYLPEDSKSTISINIMEEQFDKSPPNLRIMLEDVSVAKALEYKKLISQVDGVEGVTWMDDYVNVEQPLDMIDKSILETSYKDRNALIEVVVNDGEGLIATIAQLKEIVGEDGIVSGDAATLSFAQSSTNEEISKIMASFLIPIIIIILMISTS